MSTDGWGGRKVTRLRRYVVARDGGICCRCGLDGADTSDHYPVPKVELDPGEWFDPARVRAAHLACNLRAGGQLGNARQSERARYAEASRDW